MFHEKNLLYKNHVYNSDGPRIKYEIIYVYSPGSPWKIVFLQEIFFFKKSIFKKKLSSTMRVTNYYYFCKIKKTEKLALKVNKSVKSTFTVGPEKKDVLKMQHA